MNRDFNHLTLRQTISNKETNTYDFFADKTNKGKYIMKYSFVLVLIFLAMILFRPRPSFETPKDPIQNKQSYSEKNAVNKISQNKTMIKKTKSVMPQPSYPRASISSYTRSIAPISKENNMPEQKPTVQFINSQVLQEEEEKYNSLIKQESSMSEAEYKKLMEEQLEPEKEIYQKKIVNQQDKPKLIKTKEDEDALFKD